MPTSIDLPHGGYRKLIAYRKSETLYQGTVVFCRRFLPPHGDRTVDQMVQAARSCKQNIAEGSAAARTEARAEEWDKAMYSRLDLAKTPEELSQRASDMRSALERAVLSISHKKGWK